MGGEVALNRNPAIELYRVLLMFGIVTLHVAYIWGPAFRWENTGLAWCVDGFVFITGWFGVRFSVGKLLSLYGTAFASALMIECLACAFGYGLDSNIVMGAMKHIKGLWFLHAYAFMLFLTPIVDCVLEISNGRRLVPFLFLVFGWGLATELPIVHKFVPRPEGIGSFSGMTLLGVYTVARMIRCYGLVRYAKTRYLVLALPVLFGLCCLGYGWLGHYASPIAVLMATSVFLLFLRIQVPSFAVPIILFLGGSMFPVYVIHGHPWVWTVIKNMNILSFDREGGCFGVGIIVFGCSLLLDLPRRMLVVLVLKFVHSRKSSDGAVR